MRAMICHILMVLFRLQSVCLNIFILTRDILIDRRVDRSVLQIHRQTITRVEDEFDKDS